MQDKVLEKQYTEIASTYIFQNIQLDEAVFMSGVEYGLELREQEVADLKSQIQKLDITNGL